MSSRVGTEIATSAPLPSCDPTGWKRERKNPWQRTKGAIQGHQGILMAVGVKLPPIFESIGNIQHEAAVDDPAAAMPTLGPGVRKENVASFEAAFR